MNHSMPGLPVHHQLLEFTQTYVHWISDAISHLILCCPLLLLPSIFPSIRDCSSRSAVPIKWPKYWSFSFSISPSKEHPGLISFKMDWLDLLAVQRTLKSSPTPQFKNFHSVAFSFLHSPTFTSIYDHWKKHSLDQKDLVGKVMSLLLNILSRLVITFIPRSKHLLISLLQSPSAVILEPKKIKSYTVSTVSPSFFHEAMGPDAMIFVFWVLSFKPTFSPFFDFHQEAF